MTGTVLGWMLGTPWRVGRMAFLGVGCWIYLETWKEMWLSGLMYTVGTAQIPDSSLELTGRLQPHPHPIFIPTSWDPRTERQSTLLLTSHPSLKLLF